jgi:hypothetical protein
MDTQVIRAWPRHLPPLGYCARAARTIAANLGIDYHRFVFEGIPIDELRATGNAFAIALADFAEQEARNGQQQ